MGKKEKWGKNEKKKAEKNIKIYRFMADVSLRETSERTLAQWCGFASDIS